MSRLAHFVVALAVALTAVAVPCQALLTTPELSRHKCCGEQASLPAGSQQCQTQCASSSHPTIVSDVAVSLPAMGLACHLEQPAPPAEVAPEYQLSSNANSDAPLYLQHSSLLI